MKKKASFVRRTAAAAAALAFLIGSAPAASMAAGDAPTFDLSKRKLQLSSDVTVAADTKIVPGKATINIWRNGKTITFKARKGEIANIGNRFFYFHTYAHTGSIVVEEGAVFSKKDGNLMFATHSGQKYTLDNAGAIYSVQFDGGDDVIINSGKIYDFASMGKGDDKFVVASEESEAFLVNGGGGDDHMEFAVNGTISGTDKNGLSFTTEKGAKTSFDDFEFIGTADSKETPVRVINKATIGRNQNKTRAFRVGLNTTLENEGYINEVVMHRNNATFINAADGKVSVVQSTRRGNSVVNNGLIEGNDYGSVSLLAGSFVNNGTIDTKASDGSAIASADRFTNEAKGVINGHVAVLHGDFENKGQINGKVDVLGFGSYVYNDAGSVTADKDVRAYSSMAMLGFSSDATLSDFVAKNEQYKGFRNVFAANGATLTVDTTTVRGNEKYYGYTPAMTDTGSASSSDAFMTTLLGAGAKNGGTLNVASTVTMLDAGLMAVGNTDATSKIVIKKGDTAFGTGSILAFGNSEVVLERAVNLEGGILLNNVAIIPEERLSFDVDILDKAYQKFGEAYAALPIIDVDTTRATTLNLGRNDINTAQSVIFGSEDGSAVVKTDVFFNEQGVLDAGQVTGSVVVLNNTTIAPTFKSLVLNDSTVAIVTAKNKLTHNNVKLAGATTSDQVMHSALMDYNLNTSDASKIQLDVDLKSDADLTAMGLNPTDVRAVGTAYNGDLDVITKLLLADANGVDSITGDSNANASSDAIGSALGANDASKKVVNARVNALRTGLASGSESTFWKLWGEAFGSATNAKATGSSTGYNSDTYGLAFGIDREIMNNLRLGLAYSYAETGVDAKGSSDSNDIDSHLVTLYSDYVIGNGFYVDGRLVVGFNKYDSTRSIAALNKTASGDFDGYSVNLGTEFGRDIDVASFIVTPFLGLEYTHVITEDYDESGAGAGNLSIDGQDLDIYETILGARLSGTYGRFTPELRASWVHSWGSKDVTTSAKFVSGPALSERTVTRDADRLVLGAGLDFQATDDFKVGADVDYSGSENVESIGGSIKLTYEF